MPDDASIPREKAEFLELAATTLRSIGDAVIATNVRGQITFMNPMAERLTGWSQEEASGKDSKEVFQIVNEETRGEVQSPIDRVIREGLVVGLANHTVLLTKGGGEVPIDDSGAPIFDSHGDLRGVVLVFRDVTERKAAEESERLAREYAESIIETVRQSLLVLDSDLRVVTANRAFCQAFQVPRGDTMGALVYDLGNGQWDIPALRTLLENVLPLNSHFDDFEVEHEFETIGKRTMLLNARRLYREGNHTDHILLAIEDITERKAALEALEVSEIRFRRLFEAARDGILLLTVGTGQIVDSNPFMSELLGYSQEELQGRTLAEIGLFQDREAADAALRELQRNRYVRYEDLPMQTKARQHRDVEVVANVYNEDGAKIIQANVRDITERRRAEDAAARHQTEIVSLNERLRQAMRETHHRVKNNLQVIAAMIDVRLASRPGDLPASDVRRLADSVRTLAAVHDLLTDRARDDGGADHVEVRALCRKLLALVQSTTEVRIRSEIEDARVPSQQGSSLALVLNELVSNATKHGATEVEVEFAVRDGIRELRVCDNGPGFPPGFDPARSPTTGLQVVTTLCRWDLGGSVTFQNRAEGGACVLVAIP